MEYNWHCPKIYIGADVQYELVIKNFAQLESPVVLHAICLIDFTVDDPWTAVWLSLLFILKVFLFWLFVFVWYLFYGPLSCKLLTLFFLLLIVRMENSWFLWEICITDVMCESLILYLVSRWGKELELVMYCERAIAWVVWQPCLCSFSAVNLKFVQFIG